MSEIRAGNVANLQRRLSLKLGLESNSDNNTKDDDARDDTHVPIIAPRGFDRRGSLGSITTDEVPKDSVRNRIASLQNRFRKIETGSYVGNAENETPKRAATALRRTHSLKLSNGEMKSGTVANLRNVFGSNKKPASNEEETKTATPAPKIMGPSVRRTQSLKLKKSNAESQPAQQTIKTSVYADRKASVTRPVSRVRNYDNDDDSNDNDDDDDDDDDDDSTPETKSKVLAQKLPNPIQITASSKLNREAELSKTVDSYSVGKNIRSSSSVSVTSRGSCSDSKRDESTTGSIYIIDNSPSVLAQVVSPAEHEQITTGKKDEGKLNTSVNDANNHERVNDETHDSKAIIVGYEDDEVPSDSKPKTEQKQSVFDKVKSLFKPSSNSSTSVSSSTKKHSVETVPTVEKESSTLNGDISIDKEVGVDKNEKVEIVNKKNDNSSDVTGVKEAVKVTDAVDFNQAFLDLVNIESDETFTSDTPETKDSDEIFDDSVAPNEETSKDKQAEQRYGQNDQILSEITQLAVLKKMLSETNDVQRRREIRGAIRDLKSQAKDGADGEKRRPGRVSVSSTPDGGLTIEKSPDENEKITLRIRQTRTPSKSDIFEKDTTVTKLSRTKSGKEYAETERKYLRQKLSRVGSLYTETGAVKSRAVTVLDGTEYVEEESVKEIEATSVTAGESRRDKYTQKLSMQKPTETEKSPLSIDTGVQATGSKLPAITDEEFQAVIENDQQNSSIEVVDLLSEVTVEEGQSATLECSVLTKSTPTIWWYRNQSIIIPSDEHEQEFIENKTARLIIKKCKLHDNGVYRCIIKNKKFEVETETTLTVTELDMSMACPPDFLNELKSISSKDGQRVCFSCQVVGEPHPQVSWYKNEESRPNAILIRPNADFKQMYDGLNARLIIEEACPEDTGFYSCVAENLAGKAVSKAQLIVKDESPRRQSIIMLPPVKSKLLAPEIKEGLQPQTRKVGESLTLECTIITEAQPFIYWYKDGTVLKSSTNCIQSFEDPVAKLEIKILEAADAGEYRIEVKNVKGETSSTAKLTVTEEKPQDAGKNMKIAKEIKIDNNNRDNENFIEKIAAEKENDKYCDIEKIDIPVQPEIIPEIIQQIPKIIVNSHSKSTESTDIVPNKKDNEGPNSNIVKIESKSSSLIENANITAKLPTLKNGSAVILDNKKLDNSDSTIKKDNSESLNVFATKSPEVHPVEKKTGGIQDILDKLRNGNSRSLKRVESERRPVAQSSSTATKLHRSQSIKDRWPEATKSSNITMAAVASITDEATLQKMLNDSQDFEERKVIRTRIREVRDSSRGNGDEDEVQRRQKLAEADRQEKLQQYQNISKAPDSVRSGPRFQEDHVLEAKKRADEGKEKELMHIHELASTPTSDRLGSASERLLQMKHKQADEAKQKKLQAYDEIARKETQSSTETFDTPGGQTKTTTTTTTQKGKDGSTVTTRTQKTTSSVAGFGGTVYGAADTTSNKIAERLGNASSPKTSGQVTVKMESWSSKDGVTKREEKTQSWGAKPTGARGAMAAFKQMDTAANPDAGKKPNFLGAGGRGGKVGVQRSPSTIKQMLLSWCAAMVKQYENVSLTNFSSCWADGMAFCALIHHFHPEAFDYSQLNPKKRRYNFTLAFETAEKYADIAPLLDVEDMVRMKTPDWKCVFTYVQSFYRKFRNHECNIHRAPPQSPQ